MKTVTQNMLYRQALIRYKTNRQYIYRWLKRYDGTLESLADKSHRPHHHPNEHTPEELKLIADMRRRNPNAGLIVYLLCLYFSVIPEYNHDFFVSANRNELDHITQKVAVKFLNNLVLFLESSDEVC